MSNHATDYSGNSQVFVGDTATILGAVTSISGTAVSVNDSVTCTTLLGDVFTCLAGDLSTAGQPAVAPPYYGVTTFNDRFQAGDRMVALGVITSVLAGPWSMTGTVTVKLNFSGTVVTVSSGSCVTNSTWLNTVQA